MQHTRKLTLFSCLAALFSFQSPVNAASCLDDGSNCSLAGKWYIGLETGKAETQLEDYEVDRFFDRTGFAGSDVTIKDDDRSNAYLVGYHLTDNFAIEASYQDLGVRGLSYSGSSNNRDLFDANAGSVFPESGSGLTLGAIASWPLTERWRLSGKAGIMNWDTDTQSIDGVLLGRQSQNGTGYWYGVETSYMLTSHIQSYLGYNRFNLDHDQVDVFGLGIRLYFGGEEKSTPKASVSPVQTKVTPTRREPKPAVSATIEADTDGDGVMDSADNCAGTPKNHMVDSNGCTKYKPINYEHELTIYYPNNSSEIRAQYMTEIADMVEFAKEHDVKVIKVIGHTSKPGEEDYNQWLSVRRANSLQAILLERYGYTNNQILTEGRGETDLAVQGDTESAHSKNRRLEVQLSASGRVPMTKW